MKKGYLAKSYICLGVLYTCVTQSVVHGSTASASPWNSLEICILRFYLRPTMSDSLGVGPNKVYTLKNLQRIRIYARA